MKRLAKLFLKALDILESTAMVVFMAVATIMTFVQVIFRYVLNNSIFWAEEVVLYSIICMSFVGASMGVRKYAHISVDILNTFASARINRWLIATASVLGALFGGILLFYGWQLFTTTLQRGQLSPALRMPVAWVYIPIPIAGVLLIIRYVTLLVEVWREEPERHAIDQDKLV